MDTNLPGSDLIESGIADLSRGVESIPALLVSIGAPRLRRLGLPVPPAISSPEHRLYQRLQGSGPDSAHSRYKVSFPHYDLYAQPLAKIERGHAQDLEDVREIMRRGLIEPARALGYFQEIEAHLYRYPAIHPPSFRRAVIEMLQVG